MESENAAGPSKRQVLGFCAGVAAGALFSLALYLLARQLRPDTGLVLVSVFLIPAAASALAVLVAGIHGKGSAGKAVAMAAAVVTAMLFGSAVFFREGTICIAMAAPIFYVVSIIGALVAAVLRTHFQSRTPPSIVIVLPLLLLPIEQQSAYPIMHAAIITEIDVDAPIDAVWRDAVEIRHIQSGEQTWTFTHALLGVPRPLDAELIQRGDARVRRATWQGDIQFYEIVTDWRPDRSVAWRFDIPEAATNRLLDEHLRLDRGYLHLDGGAYEFTALSPTRTRLRLVTRFSARTPWNAYALLWGRLVLGDIHRNVLTIVRARTERHQ